jgi:hypothetical protein
MSAPGDVDFSAAETARPAVWQRALVSSSRRRIGSILNGQAGRYSVIGASTSKPVFNGVTDWRFYEKEKSC